jgi:MFS family permease
MTGRKRAVAFLICALGMGPAAVAFGFVRTPWPAMGLLFAAGLMAGFNTIHSLSLAQLTTPPEMRGRVLGLFETLGLSTMPLAAGTAGIVADLLHRNIPLVYWGCGVGLAAVALLQLTKREVREFLAFEPGPDAAVISVDAEPTPSV